DRENRPHPLTKGEPITRMLVNTLATAERCQAGGDPGFVPPYDASLLLDTDFRSKLPLVPPTPPSRDTGLRAFPSRTPAPTGPSHRKEAGEPRKGKGVGDEKAGPVREAGARAVLAQEIRNARGGYFTFAVTTAGVGSSRDEFEKTFLDHLACRLVLFR